MLYKEILAKAIYQLEKLIDAKNHELYEWQNNPSNQGAFYTDDGQIYGHIYGELRAYRKALSLLLENELKNPSLLLTKEITHDN